MTGNNRGPWPLILPGRSPAITSIKVARVWRSSWPSASDWTKRSQTSPGPGRMKAGRASRRVSKSHSKNPPTSDAISRTNRVRDRFRRSGLMFRVSVIKKPRLFFGVGIRILNRCNDLLSFGLLPPAPAYHRFMCVPHSWAAPGWGVPPVGNWANGPHPAPKVMDFNLLKVYPVRGRLSTRG